MVWDQKEVEVPVTVKKYVGRPVRWARDVHRRGERNEGRAAKPGGLWCCTVGERFRLVLSWVLSWFQLVKHRRGSFQRNRLGMFCTGQEAESNQGATWVVWNVGLSTGLLKESTWIERVCVGLQAAEVSP